MKMRRYDLREQKQFGKRLFLVGDSVPKPLGFTAFPPEWLFSFHWGGRRRPAIPAAGSALRSHPCVAVPSAQVRSVYSAPQRPRRLNCKKACPEGCQ